MSGVNLPLFTIIEQDKLVRKLGSNLLPCEHLPHDDLCWPQLDCNFWK